MKAIHTKASASRLLLAAFAAAAMLVAVQPKAEAKISAGGAAVLGGVAGLAVGAAIADSHKNRNKTIYYQGYNPPYQPGGYDPYFNQAFSPAAGIVCYPAQRLCYNNGGSISGGWTRSVYGY